MGLFVLAGVALGVVVLGIVWQVLSGPGRPGSLTTKPDATVTQPAATSTSTKPVEPAIAVGVRPVGNGYLLVLESISQSTTTKLEAWESVKANLVAGPKPVFLDSTRTPGLNGGYWVAASGLYASKDEAQAQCASFGRVVGGTCYAKPVQLTADSHAT